MFFTSNLYIPSSILAIRIKFYTFVQLRYQQKTNQQQRHVKQLAEISLQKL
uniref:Bm14211 n=1 Tax=Brugia malayi TaxID=6279 RepID=A0A0J9XUX1_BRUMA|nr:Bm14211 [Brugia malayi]